MGQNIRVHKIVANVVDIATKTVNWLAALLLVGTKNLV